MKCLLLPLIALAGAAVAETGSLDTVHPGIDAFIEEMVSSHDLKREDLVGILSTAEKKDSIIAAMTRPAEA
ncbi:MAG: hypothetical protein R3200_16250, partial [Xanthomonadales bacterium]|nr:hypothetical protein [Xanthomonadales bacterium]